MKNVLLICLIILFFSCKENHKGLAKEILNKEEATENTGSKENTEVDYQYQIIPGKRLGNIIFNENATVILDSLGTPDSGDAAMGKAISTWHEGTDNQLSIFTSTKMGVEDFPRITGIRSSSSKYKTENNLGVNSTFSEIEKHFQLNKIGAFTSEDQTYTLYSTEKGMRFEMGEDQKCHGIVLTEPGTRPEQFYVSFYSDFKKE